MKILLKAGDKLEIGLEDAEGTFTIDYNSEGNNTLEVRTDLPDDLGRNHVIYKDTHFHEEDNEKAAV